MTKLPVVVLLSLAHAGLLHAQNYSVDWHKFSNGQGASGNGGPYSLSGTIGQPDAHNTFTGGQFTLTGGFWSIVSVVQTPGAPELSLALASAGTVTISWPAPSTGFVLQQNATLNPATWTNVGSPVISDGTVNQVQVISSAGHLFFRLYYPGP